MEFFAEVVSISKIKQNCYLNVRFAKLEQLVPGRVQAIGIDSCRSAISLKHSFRLETTRTQNQRLFQTDNGRSVLDANWHHQVNLSVQIFDIFIVCYAEYCCYLAFPIVIQFHFGNYDAPLSSVLLSSIIGLP